MSNEDTKTFRWVRYVDHKGMPYYWNPATKTSSWIKPLERGSEELQEIFLSEDCDLPRSLSGSKLSAGLPGPELDLQEIHAKLIEFKNNNDDDLQKARYSDKYPNPSVCGSEEFRWTEFNESRESTLIGMNTNPFRSSIRRTSIALISNQDEEVGLFHEYEQIGDKSILRSESSVYTIYALQDWISQFKHLYEPLLKVRLQYPERLESRNFPHGNESFTCLVHLPKSGVEDVAFNMKVVLHPSDTVRDVIRHILRNYPSALLQKNKKKASAPSTNIDDYFLKVNGWNEYIIQLDSFIFDHSSVSYHQRNEYDLALSLLQCHDSKMRRDVATLRKASNKSDSCHERRIDFASDFKSAAIVTSNSTSKSAMRKGEDRIPLSWLQIQHPFRIRIQSMENCPQTEVFDDVIVECGLYYGPNLLSPNFEVPFTDHKEWTAEETESQLMRTKRVPFGNNPRFPSSWITSSVFQVCNLPQATKLGLIVYGVHKNGDQKTPIACTVLPLCDYQGNLLCGKQTVPLWACSPVSLSKPTELYGDSFTPRPNPTYPYNCVDLIRSLGADGQDVLDGGSLYIELDCYTSNVNMKKCAAVVDINHTGSVQPQGLAEGFHAQVWSGLESSCITSTEQQELVQLSQRKDVLLALSTKQKILLWQSRSYCRTIFSLLAPFLQAVNWACPQAAHEAHRLVSIWQKPSHPRDVIELLNDQHADPFVRSYAVNILYELPAHEFSEVLLQLIQALKFEQNANCALTRMLLLKCLQQPHGLGQRFFWLLRSEQSYKMHFGLFNSILLTYLMLSKNHHKILKSQVNVVDQLEMIARIVKGVEKKEQKSTLRKELQRFNQFLPKTFQLCLSSRFEASSFVVKHCKVMDSAKSPLWLCFENADPLGKPMHAIFKCGDDLRQDIMALQMIEWMDRVWREAGLDLGMKPYMCQSSGVGVGLIEVVPNAMTIAQIHHTYGVMYFGALMETPIDSFLREKSSGNQTRYEEYVNNFVRTCAGYCVATYILGIGDRHSDNIMIDATGHLFHIDYGHFLGHFKKKFGINRERAPLVFTPEMAFVMGTRTDERYLKFEALCCQAYNIVRANATPLFNFFMMMLPAQVPELQSTADIDYLRQMLSLSMSEAEATRKMKKEIKSALASTSRRVDNLFHNMKHGSDIFG